MRKKVDERIRTLIENGVKLRHRSMFVIVGDKYRDQIVNLHHLLSKAVVKSSPSVLWCYKEELELSSHKKKRLRQAKRMLQRGTADVERLDPFLLFVETSRLKHCKYRDSERILGNTFGMCVLQDFEALTPNLLARTIETVEGGGLVVLVLRSLTSLTRLFTMVMDVHGRFRTESHSQSASRFNERFLLSIASCKACVVMDDELNILPISSHIRSIKPVSASQESEGLSEAERNLKNLKEELQDQILAGPLIKKCCTFDQGNALVTFLDAIMNRTLRSTVALTAARGRGKSASLGLAIAGAIAAGFSNIYVTAPSPENLKTLFEFVIKGLNELEYKEHLHYDLVRSNEPDIKKSVVKINVYKQHRQTIQYLQPQDHKKLSQVELLVIDEAAAIPLPIVKSLLGPYLVFLSSTVNGYEGTGRSLSLKLIHQLEEQSQMPTNNSDGCQGTYFKKVELSESIRYAPNDPIESWLNGLLCLDVASYIPSIASLPDPDKCQLYYVNRDTLFSYHRESEVFLQRMMALYVASHYKNSPNDLQLMADAPAHHLFVLLGPVDETKNELPDILCVVQVSLEGKISQKSVLKSLSGGHQPYGDQIPWKFSEQFRDEVFPSLSGARIVRIAVHPSAMRLGYGSAAVRHLTSYYEGKISPLNVEEDDDTVDEAPKVTEIAKKVSLLEENIVPRANLPPLLVPLDERNPEKLHYLGVSFGLTQNLFRFWRKLGFAPFYICQIPNDVTGEHNCMVLKPLNNDEIENKDDEKYGFIGPYYRDFRERFIHLLPSCFREMDYKLAMSILDPKLEFREHDNDTSTSECSSLPKGLISPHAMKRLEGYTNNFVDYHMILDLVPVLAHEYFLERLPVTLTSVQASVLLCMGLQNQDISYIQERMKIEKQQIMSYFNKIMRKFYKYLNNISAQQLDSQLPQPREILMQPHGVTVDEDLKAAAMEVTEKMKSERVGLLDPSILQQYAIMDKDAEIEKALQSGGGKLPRSGIITVKSIKSNGNLGSSEEVHKRRKDRERASHGSNKKKARQ